MLRLLSGCWNCLRFKLQNPVKGLAHSVLCWQKAEDVYKRQLFVVIGALVSDNRDGSIVWISLGIMSVSRIGRIITTYFSTMEQTETGYCMVAEKRIHSGERLRYIPMGYFNKNSIGNITAIVTTTLGDVENSAAV